jgi:hypothetical protein
MQKCDRKRDLRHFEEVKKELPHAYKALKSAYHEVLREENFPNQAHLAQKTKTEFLRLVELERLVNTQSMFITQSGYVGQTMTGVHCGDEIVLVHGAPVPYIFRRVEDALRIEIDLIKEHMGREWSYSPSVQRREQWLRDLESHVGKKDGWVVVGEAYVEGVMKGEFERGDAKAERFALV